MAPPSCSRKHPFHYSGEGKKEGGEERRGGFVFIASPPPPVGQISLQRPESRSQQQSHSFHRGGEPRARACAPARPASLPLCLSASLRRCEAFDLSAPNRFVFSADERTNKRTLPLTSHFSLTRQVWSGWVDGWMEGWSSNALHRSF